MGKLQLRNDDDRRMWREVYEGNEYGLPACMSGWVVLDVGANVGAFSRLAVERGARVTAYEPDQGNFEALVGNLEGVAKGFAGFATHRAAVWEAEGSALLWRGADPSGYTLARGTGEQVPTVTAMGAVVQALKDWGERRVDLMKLDAEGAEYVVCRDYEFAAVRRLAIEFHGAYGGGPVAAQVARERLARLGFRELEWRGCHEELGWFRLYRGERV